MTPAVAAARLMAAVGGLDVAVVAGAVLVVVAVLVGAAVQRRSVAARLASLAARMGDTGGAEPVGGVEPALQRLEHAADEVQLRTHAAVTEADRLRWALGAIPQGVVICDDTGREVFRNRAARAFAGARHAEALVEQAVREQIDAALAGVPQRRNLDLYGPPRRMLVISTVALDDGERATGALAVIDDVSERRRLEAVRRDFIANISHELKTPIGALGLLAETIAAADDPAVTHRLAARMTEDAFRVGRIVDDLLDLSRIEAQEAPLREPVAVPLVVAEAVERVRGLAEAKRIAIDTDGVTGSVTIDGDRRQLVSALFNLLENAIKYSDDGSTVEVVQLVDGPWIELSVRDHGIGIPTRDLERVFERFYRVDRARSRDTGGTGLGLAIVRHVATNHHGDVGVVSREGEGSTFTLRLPAGAGAGVVTTDSTDDAQIAHEQREGSGRPADHGAGGGGRGVLRGGAGRGAPS